MFRSVAFWMFRPVHCQKNRVILVLCHTFVGMPFCQLFRLFSCPWVDRIYCYDYVTTKIESKCRRREILFLCVSSRCQRRTQVAGRIHPESSGMCSYNECKSNASLRPHVTFWFFFYPYFYHLLLMLVDVQREEEGDESSPQVRGSPLGR